MFFDFANIAANVALLLFLVRFIQIKSDPTSDFGKALAYLFH